MPKNVFIPVCPACEEENSLFLADNFQVECKKCKAVVIELHEHGDWVHGFGSLYQEFEDVGGTLFPVGSGQQEEEEEGDDDGEDDGLGL